MIYRSRALLKSFGLDPDQLYWSPAAERYSDRIVEAVQSRRLISVIGPFGSGKSVLVRASLAGAPRVELVYVNQPDKENLRIGQIASAMIYELSAENPRRDNMARAKQLERLVGQKVVVEGREICVVIENAHRLHAGTLLALKDLREGASFKGRALLFSVILIGQEPLRQKLERFGEVFFRTKTIDLAANGWMDLAERTRYLEAVYGGAIAPKTRARLAALFTSPLELDHFLEGKLEQLRDAGLKVLDDEALPLSLSEQRQALHISLREIERRTQIPRSTISDAEHGRNTDPDVRRRIQEALDDIAQKKAA